MSKNICQAWARFSLSCLGEEDGLADPKVLSYSVFSDFTNPPSTQGPNAAIKTLQDPYWFVFLP